MRGWVSRGPSHRTTGVSRLQGGKTNKAEPEGSPPRAILSRSLPLESPIKAPPLPGPGRFCRQLGRIYRTASKAPSWRGTSPNSGRTGLGATDTGRSEGPLPPIRCRVTSTSPRRNRAHRQRPAGRAEHKRTRCPRRIVKNHPPQPPMREERLQGSSRQTGPNPRTHCIRWRKGTQAPGLEANRGLPSPPETIACNSYSPRTHRPNDAARRCLLSADITAAVAPIIPAAATAAAAAPPDRTPPPDALPGTRSPDEPPRLETPGEMLACVDASATDGVGARAPASSHLTPVPAPRIRLSSGANTAPCRVAAPPVADSSVPPTQRAGGYVTVEAQQGQRRPCAGPGDGATAHPSHGSARRWDRRLPKLPAGASGTVLPGADGPALEPAALVDGPRPRVSRKTSLEEGLAGWGVPPARVPSALDPPFGRDRTASPGCVGSYR